ncbi:helix-turn-helix domain-containing protein [Kitasatospora sp. NBC_00315]|uniref:helix-turn-helix domain-containing protein n=1 Tax=Kitasatospora sp. NBC_00315 TaxID=2975963 RepID=UPI0032474311
MHQKDVDPTSGPLAAFGVQLRRSRRAAGLSQVELGAAVAYSNTFISYLETARREPSHRFAVAADAVLNTGGTLELMWWNLKHTALLEGFPEYATLEAKATDIRMFELGVIPGLLQTREYATTLAHADVRRGGIARNQAEERVDFLLARQRLLDRGQPPLVHAVLDESCLRRPVGGAEVMAAQFQHLEALVERPDVIIQVAPFLLAEERPFAHPVYLLSLADGSMLGYTESHQRGFLERDTATVKAWARNYDRLQVGALSEAASLAMIREARKDHHDRPR